MKTARDSYKQTEITDLFKLFYFIIVIHIILKSIHNNYEYKNVFYP